MAIQFELSKDSTFLQAYYAIRQSCFRQELGLPSFDGSEDEFDRQGVILIARDGDRCVGGVRLSAGASDSGTPMERGGMALGSIFPQLEAGERDYCQITRLALDPAYRTPQSSRELMMACIDLAVEEGFNYAFCVAGMNRSRLYKRVMSAMGYDFRIFEQVAVPPEKGFSGLPHLLSVARLGDEVAELYPVMSTSLPLARVA